MKSIEYQAFIKLRDNVWTTVFKEIVSDWTIPKCKVIAESVETVTNLKVDAKSIQRFAKLLENQVATNQTKYILAMFLAHQKAENGQWVDKTAWYQFAQGCQDSTQQQEELKNPMTVYAGDYILYYKHVLTNKLSDSISIQIQENGDAHFQGHASKFGGQVIWRPLNPNLFIIFKNDNDYMFLILKVRAVSSRNYLSYLAGCFSAVGITTGFPYGQLVLLVNKKEQTVDLDRVHAYFQKLGDHHKVTLDQDIAKILNFRIPLETIIEPSTKKLSLFIGNWYIYSHSYSHPNTINRDILIIKSLSEIHYCSISNVSTGKIKLKGGTKVIIELENDDIQAQIIVNIQHRQILNFQMEKCVFTSTGVYKPVTGIAFLEKVDTEAEKMIAKTLYPKDAEYSILEQTGILAALKAVPNIYL